MKSKEAWGWLTAGVLALGLNGIYHDGGAAWIHRCAQGIASRIEAQTGPVLALAAGRSEWFLARAEMTAARGESSSCHVQSAVARWQGRIARAQGQFAQFEAMSARQEAAMARMEANRARVEARISRTRMEPAMFVEMETHCPRVRGIPKVEIPRIDIDVPGVQVNVSGQETF